MVTDNFYKRGVKMTNEYLSTIKEVKQSHREDEINNYLKLGWTVINTHTTDYGHPVERHQNTVFTLVWTKDEEPVHPKKEVSDYDMFVENGSL